MHRQVFRNCLLIALLAVTWVQAQQQLEPQPLKLRVLSYNIHHAEGVDGKLDVERIARVIRSVEPDLVALQEVDQNVQRTRGVDQPAELAERTGLHVAFGRNLELQGGHYGNAVLSRYPLVAQQNHLLPRIDESEQRGVLDVRVGLPEPHPPIRFLATHWDFRSDNRERLASADFVNRLVLATPRLPALLAGDLNARFDSEPLARLGSTWSIANLEPLATVPVERPTQQIDFVLCRPRDRWRAVDVQVLPEATASDHRAILAVLELLPAAR